jgi:amidase
MDNSLIDKSVTELARLIRRSEVSAEETVIAFLDRIEHVNPKINAVVHLRREAALEEARAADNAMHSGRNIGPLHGVPFTVKDSFDTAGTVSTAGITGRAAYIPGKDAAAVARLLSAGAILLGKTNTSEITMGFETTNLLFGRTNNPYNLEMTSGGSSGGAAAILAVGGAPFEIGTDTGGSIRLPAHFCGIAGLKPTQGRIPRTGHVVSFDGPHQFLTHVGPLARYVEDLNLLYAILAGPDGVDPYMTDMQRHDPHDVDLENLRVAYFLDNGDVAANNETCRVVMDAVNHMAETGAPLEEARPEPIEESYDFYLSLLWADGGAWARRILDKSGTEKTIFEERITQFKPLPIADYTALIERWDLFKSRMLSFWRNYDVLICPVNAHEAIPHGTTYQGRNLAAYGYTMAFNLTGWPSAVVRCGTSSNGLPIGVQVVARPWREDVCLAVAQHLEQLHGWKRPDYGA